MDLQKVTEKVAKLMALSNSNNPNEAAVALARAQKLMQEYQISMDDVTLSSINEQEQTLPTILRDRMLYTSLGQIIASSFGLEHFYRSFGRVVKSVVFIGPEERVASASYAFNILVRQAAIVKKDFVQVQRDEVSKAYSKSIFRKEIPFKDIKKTFMTSDPIYGEYLYQNLKKRIDSEVRRLTKAYLIGWLRAIREKVVEFAKTDEEVRLIEQYMTTNYPSLGTMSASRQRRFTADQMNAYRNGVSDGQNGIELFRGVNNHAEQRYALTHNS